jgi:hypothetical protein
MTWVLRPSACRRLVPGLCALESCQVSLVRGKSWLDPPALAQATNHGRAAGVRVTSRALHSLILVRFGKHPSPPLTPLLSSNSALWLREKQINALPGIPTSYRDGVGDAADQRVTSTCK